MIKFLPSRVAHDSGKTVRFCGAFSERTGACTCACFQFTNNLAERDIRPARVKLKISNCFRTSAGADSYARIEEFLSPARKHNKNVFSELSDTFNGIHFITA